MEKKIISFVAEDKGTCLICCERQATVSMKIRRLKYDETILSFHLCDECLAKMQKDIEKV